VNLHQLTLGKLFDYSYTLVSPSVTLLFRRCTWSVYSCVDMTSVANAVVSRHDDTTVVKCITSSVTSVLTCVDGRWTGQLINCTTVTLGIYLIHMAISLHYQYAE